MREEEFLSEYQKWVDEQSDLVDAIMGMYQVDTSPENLHLEDDEEEERMSTWVNSLIIQKAHLVWGVYIKDFLEPCPSPRHYLQMCVCVSPHIVYVCVYVHMVL